ncbi:MAG: co-chaperone GroES [Patescibacteria group bacterium]
MSITPVHDHIIVKPIASEGVTKSGLVLPDTGIEKPEKGEVIAVGPGKVLDNGNRAAMSAKVGDKVMFKKYAPDEIKIDGVEYFVISDGDVIAILT